MTDIPANPNEKRLATPTNYDKIRALSHNKSVVDSFAQILGNRAEAQAYIGSVLIAVRANSALMECQPASIMQVALRAATLRLSCDPALGQAYPVPYNDNQRGKIAQLQLGYKGIEQMALRTGKYRHINTSPLYKGEILEQNRLTGAVAMHGNRESDEVLGYYNYFELFTGYAHCLYMTVEEIHAHAKRYSKNYEKPSSKWQTEFDKMARKTVLRLHLLRDGVLSIQDKATLESAKMEGEQMEGQALEDEIIDASFEEIDVEAEAFAEKQAEAAKPKRSEAEILKEMGFDAPKDKETEKPTAAPEVPASAYQVFIDQAKGGDPRGAFLGLARSIGTDHEAANAIYAEAGKDYGKAFDKLLQQAPPAQPAMI